MKKKKNIVDNYIKYLSFKLYIKMKIYFSFVITICFSKLIKKY